MGAKCPRSMETVGRQTGVQRDPEFSFETHKKPLYINERVQKD